MAGVETDSDDGIGMQELLKRTGGALALALVMNWIVLYVVLEFGLAPPFEALEFGPVTLFTVVGVAGAAAVYGVLTRISETPDETFVKIAAAVLLLSFIPDVALYVYDPEATLAVAVALAFMHVTAAAACVVGLTEYVEVP